MTRKLKIQFYRDKKREWRWRIKSGSRVLADSGEGYKRLAKAVHGINVVAAMDMTARGGTVQIYGLDADHATVEVIR